MTEHKFTDKEIIKALKCCWCGDENMLACKGCPLRGYKGEDLCMNALYGVSLDLIKRQKADIERLTKLLDDKCDRCIARDKAEAIKEFADRLKTYYRNLDKTAGGLVEYHIDQIAKEFLERGAADSQDNH